MVAASDHLVGVGLYTAEEAARYARISSRTMSRWVFGDNSGAPVIRSQLKSQGEPERFVTFLDFVQAMAVRSVRLREKQFPLQKIRAACEAASDRFDLQFPLAARDHRIYLFGPRDNLKLCEMVIACGKDPAGDEQYLQLSGKKRGSYLLTQVVEPFMSQLVFGDSRYAERFVAWSHNEQSIVMDPSTRLGEPYLPSCGYTALALWEAYLSEGGVEEAAKAYDVADSEVELACSYFDFLTGADAA